MQWFKRSALAAALLFLIPLSGYSASDDGTFTITIQGPEVEDTNTRPARNTNRQNQRQQQTQPAASNQNHNQQRQQSAQNTPQSSQQTAVNQSQSAPATPTVANGTNYRVSAGETIWSVAHRLVPVDKKVNEFQIIASIYRNNPNAFVDHNVHSLVRGANLLIPPVSEIALEDSNVGSALLKNGSYTLQPLKTNRNSSTGIDLSTEEYTATETRVKELQAQRELQMDDPVVNKNDTRQADLEIPSQTADAKKNLDEKLLANTGASAESVDAQAIRIMLDETKKSIDAKTRQLENQLAQAIERMKKSTAMTAQTSADSVSTLASQYDNIIAGIQQDIIELKGRMSKMSQDNDRMREMLLANDEKLEDIQLQMTQYSVSTADANLELDKPVLMILFGSGLLTLVLIILVIIFKLRTRASQRALSDDFDFDDSVADDVLLSNADGSIDLETPTDVEDEDQSKGGRSETVNANALDAPSSNPSEVQAALDGAASEQAKSPDEAEAQKQWDSAASSDSSGADAWAAALNEQAEGEKKEESSQEDMADAWAAALGEQAEGEKKEESSQEDMADAWAAALGEQAESEKKEESSQENMADAWAAALGEQEKAAEDEKSAEEKAKAEQEAMAAAWTAALDDLDKNDSKSVEIENNEVSPASDEAPSLDEKKDDKDIEPASDIAPSLEENKSDEKVEAASDIAPDLNDLLDESVDKKEEPAKDDIDLDALMDSSSEEKAPESADDILASLGESAPEVASEAVDLENALKQKEKEEFTEEISLDDVLGETKSEPASDDAPISEELPGELNDLANAFAKDAEEVKQNVEDAAKAFDKLDDIASDLIDESESKEITSASDEAPDLTDIEDTTSASDEAPDLTDIEDTTLASDEAPNLSDIESPSDEAPDLSQSDDELLSSYVASNSDNEMSLEAQSLAGAMSSQAEEVPEDESEDESEDDFDEDFDDSEFASDIPSEDEHVELPEENKLTQSDEVAELNEVLSNVDDDKVEVHDEDTSDAAADTEELEALLASTGDGPEDDIQEEVEEPVEEQHYEVEDGGAVLSSDEEKAMLDALTGEHTKKAAKNEDFTEDDFNIPLSEDVPESIHEVVEDDLNLEELLTEKAHEEQASEQAENETVSWTVPEDDDLNGKSDDSVEAEDESSDEEDLKELEKRFSMSKEHYDAESENDLANMLGTEDVTDVKESLSEEEPDEEPFSADDIASMLSSAAVSDESLDDVDSYEEPEEVSPAQDPVEEELDTVSDKIGPIDEDGADEDKSESIDDSDNVLSPKEHQYYTDELNLARLYFETGDTEEALKIIEDVKSHGSADLIEEADKVVESYAN